VRECSMCRFQKILTSRFFEEEVSRSQFIVVDLLNYVQQATTATSLSTKHVGKNDVHWQAEKRYIEDPARRVPRVTLNSVALIDL
jgi:hypothetical protein